LYRHRTPRSKDGGVSCTRHVSCGLNSC
jgi:hypothetical protein